MRSPSLLWSAAQAAQATPVPDIVGGGTRTNTVQSATSITISNYVVPAGSNQILVVHAFAAEFQAEPVSTGITFGGSPMTDLQQDNLVSGNTQLRIVTKVVVAPSGTANIVASWSSSDSPVGRLMIIARTYSNVKQSTPTLIDTSAVVTSAGVSTTLNSVLARSMVVDGMHCGQNSTDAPATTGTGQTQIVNQLDAQGTQHFCLSERLAASAGNVTFGWDEDTFNTEFWTHSMLALESA